MTLDTTKWENGIIGIPANADFVASLDKIGEESWEPWAVLGADPQSQIVRVAVKRPKRLIEISGSMPGNIVTN